MKALLLGCLAAIGASALAAEPADDTRWYSIETQTGVQIGHASREVVNGPGGREIVESQEIDQGDPGEVTPNAPWFSASHGVTLTWRTTRQETEDGRTVSLSSEAQSSPEWRNDWSRSKAEIQDGHADITRTTPAETRVMTIALPPNVSFDDGETAMRTWNTGATPRLEFDNFNIDAMTVDHVVLDVTAPPDAAGDTNVLRKTYNGGQLMAVTRIVLDRDGRVSRVTQPMFGTSIILKLTDRDGALKAHSPYLAVPSSMTKSPFRINSGAMRGHIRYRFAFGDRIEFALPQTGEQRATAEPGFVTLDICMDCGPGLRSDAATLADALKPTAWLQSDAPAIKAIVDPVAKMPVSDTRKMEILTRKARSYLTHLDFAGHYSALETISRRSGDCTEAATLLAAFGRAAGIPTRVADGLVYSRESYHGVSNAFLPHSWTLAFVDGQWRSFDAALDTFDSTHIALVVGDGDARSLSAAAQLSSLLRWDTIAEVRPVPEN